MSLCINNIPKTKVITLNPRNKEPHIRRTVPAEELAKRRIAEPSTIWDPWKSVTPEEKEALKKAYQDAVTKNRFHGARGSPHGGNLPIKKHENWSDHFNSGTDYEFEIKKILAKDPRVKTNDKYMIVKAVSKRTSEIGNDGKTLGDIVREEVEKYLADMAKPAQLAQVSRLPQMDPEAALKHIIRYALLVGPIRSEMEKNNAIGIFLALERYEKDLIVDAISCVPDHRLKEKASGNATIHNLITILSISAISDELSQAAIKKLEK